jgi:hypothetical protein
MTVTFADVINAQLEEPWQRVWVRNTAPEQPNGLFDRAHKHHMLQPGERRQIDMLVRDVVFFNSLRLSRQYVDDRDGILKWSKPHPLLIEDAPQPLQPTATAIPPEAVADQPPLPATARPPVDAEQLVKSERPVEPAPPAKKR